jgi:predicted Zn finger-like uncharacterized protein
MRLICPNCGAQYEVDTSMIPDEGRDVQCSACGHTWYQMPEGAEAVAEPEIEDEIEVEETIEIEETVEDVAAPPAPPAEAPMPPKPSERLDADILGMLREEAQREADARRAEQAEALEVQPELGLAEEDLAPPTPPRPDPRRIDGDEDDLVAAPGSRGDLLPDIEEINSSLRPASEHAEAAAIADPVAVAARERTGFRWGFTLMIVLAALLVIAYVFAPQIGRQAPALEPALAGYVDAANGLRDSVEGLLDSTTESLSNMTEGEGE